MQAGNIISTLQMKRLRFTEVRGLAQPGLEAGLLISSSLAFPFCSENIKLTSLLFDYVLTFKGDRETQLRNLSFLPARVGSKLNFYKVSLFVSPKELSYQSLSLRILKSHRFCLFWMPKVLQNRLVHMLMWRYTWISTGYSSQIQTSTQGSRPLPTKTRTGLQTATWSERPDVPEALGRTTPLAGSHRTQGSIPPWVEGMSFISFCAYSFSVCFETKIWRQRLPVSFLSFDFGYKNLI